MTQWEPWQPITYHHTTNKGWCWTFHILGFVIRQTKKRVLVQLLKNDGSSVERWVKPENLTARELPPVAESLKALHDVIGSDLAKIEDIDAFVREVRGEE